MPDPKMASIEIMLSNQPAFIYEGICKHSLGKLPEELSNAIISQVSSENGRNIFVAVIFMIKVSMCSPKNIKSESLCEGFEPKSTSSVVRQHLTRGCPQ